jgi:phage baseplate assembly protein W
MSSDEEDIKEAIYIILMTQKGERLLLPNFGSRINDYVFEVMDQTTLTLMANDIKRSIANYEKRIKDLDVLVEIDKDNTSKLILNIKYKVAQNNSVGNLVFPFYLQEGVGESNVG